MPLGTILRVGPLKVPRVVCKTPKCREQSILGPLLTLLPSIKGDTPGHQGTNHLMYQNWGGQDFGLASYFWYLFLYV